jgi:cytoplasmic tRNA 2-thiolation protein 1
LYAYEKEIVMYAHHKKLDYFSTECIYSPEAFRGSARTLIKNLERIRPESILDVVRSGIDMAKLVPGVNDTATQDANVATGKAARSVAVEPEGPGGCGTSKESGGEMAAMEKKLQQDEAAESNGNETEIKMPKKVVPGQNGETRLPEGKNENADLGLQNDQQQIAGKQTVPFRPKNKKQTGKSGKDAPPPKQKLGQCERCGYLSSQAVCKACVLLEGLNKARPRTGIEVGGD